ncbi:hypothetical protein [Neisseria sp. Marseille-Q6792]|nr:hypothetical protein [Neisseria sp. Marseille-Q6792]
MPSETDFRFRRHCLFCITKHEANPPYLEPVLMLNTYLRATCSENL